MGALVTMLIQSWSAIGVLRGRLRRPEPAREQAAAEVGARVRPWVFVGPALLFLFILHRGAVAADHLPELPQRPARRERLHARQLHQRRCTDNTVVNFDNCEQHLHELAVHPQHRPDLIAGARSSAAATPARATGAGSRSTSRAPVAVIAHRRRRDRHPVRRLLHLRGVIWNNLWWVAAVTGLATVFGLGFAVLADRSKGETSAKTLIFMPFAISMVGAAIIWTLHVQPRRRPDSRRACSTRSSTGSVSTRSTSSEAPASSRGTTSSS